MYLQLVEGVVGQHDLVTLHEEGLCAQAEETRLLVDIELLAD